MANTTTGLKNVNLLTKDRYLQIEQPATDELYAISGSGFGFPSSNYEDLELGASGAEYVAPANGYFIISKYATAAGQYVGLYNPSNGYGVFNIAQGSSSLLELDIPVMKSELIQINYTIAGTMQRFRFIYAEGE